MGYLLFTSEFETSPEVRIDGYAAFQGYTDIVRQFEDTLILTVDCYPGVHDDEVLNAIAEGYSPDLIIHMKDIFLPGEQILGIMRPFLTDDRVRGVMYHGGVIDFIDRSRLNEARKQVENCSGKVLIYGFAAALVTNEGTLVYADLARWEIQLRYRTGMPNYKLQNHDEEFLRKYKCGFFVEWRIADKHKATLYDRMDYYLDTNEAQHPRMVEGDGFRNALISLTARPFSLVPYFDPGVWGGQWMKEVCHLDPSQPNYAWAFVGVPEENSLYLNFGGIRIESPAMNLTKYRPEEFLGKKTFSRFGAEFPIRFDFLDTMDGQNLSLQVHPTTEYIVNTFGMTYTQDESYYIMDAKDDGAVYLGFKEGIDPKKCIADLKTASTGAKPFDADVYVNKWPAKKHDHFLIPAGTVHCSSKNCMVLEISATPYIFTFKLWDWDRVDLDGLPRPIHIEHGEKVLQYHRDTTWVRDNLINRFEVLEYNDDYTVTRTGLHELEFIETQLLETSSQVYIPSHHEFAQLNLVEGMKAIVTSPSGRFAPMEIHYAETFILPADAGDYVIEAVDGEAIKVIKADVRF
ncbi:MAG: class I mannose-6-phosphate isomerase [Sphaerochaetaceae bacterium]|nr:class I mannose-6-phosphate isomerase [Sphaerochaetaceae bacterium]